MLLLKHLGLPLEVMRRFSQAKVTTWQACSNLTIDDLLAMDFNASQAERIQDYLDGLMVKRFRKEMLFPQLPEAFHFIEIEALELPAPIVERLKAHQVAYLYQCAFQRRPTVFKQWNVSEKVVHFLTDKLSQFTASYRHGQIVLTQEDEI
jgi:hypothetical protein